MDTISKEKRSWNMSRIRNKDTRPELMVRKYLFSKGYRYYVNSSLEGRPDIVFPAKKAVVFVHGCFWHQHGCKDTYQPKSNKQFWNKKLRSNVKRDLKVKNSLIDKGWKTFYIWECEINNNLELGMDKLLKELSYD